MKEIYSKLEQVSERLNSIDKTLVKQEENLAEHMRRSLANEEAVDRIAEELKPVLDHVVIVKFIGKVLGILLTSGLIASIINYVVR